MQEYRILGIKKILLNSTCRHPNILEMFAYFKDEKRVYFLLEFAPGGELFKELKNCERFDEPRSAEVSVCRKLFQELCDSFKREMSVIAFLKLHFFMKFDYCSF